MKPQLLLSSSLLMPLAAILGCGSSPSSDFSMEAAPATITVVPGGASQSLSVVATPQNNFKGTVAVTLGSLPAGVAATPSNLSLAAGTLGLFTISASPIASPGSATITVTGTSGSLSHKATSSLTVGPPITVPFLSATSFDFGDNLVNNTITHTVVVVTNPGPDALTLSPTLSGDPSYSIASAMSCGSQLAAGASCDMVLNYTPTTASAPATQNATLNMGFGDVPAGTPQTVAITGTSGALTAGQVTATANPQVALYTLNLPFPGSMTINFGTTTGYGLQTWSRSTPTAGPIRILVGGMLASTTYHMQAGVTLSNGIAAKDSDHTFTTGAVPANMQLALQSSTTPGMTPQPGLEMIDAVTGSPSGLLVTDLAGNILWTYVNPGSNPALNLIQLIEGVKMLPNGDFLISIGAFSTLSGPIPPEVVNEIREINLAGDTVREISITDLNTELASATCAECNVTLGTFHHDVTPLPNGHWLVLATTKMALSPTSTPPLTNQPPTIVLGDVIVDLNQAMQPVWAWSTFNHLDPNRHPMSFPDWTHANAVVYSADDGNILFSMRSQNWVLKLNYSNGTGDGSILWRLGQGGDFTLVGGTDPTDWEYAQHLPSFFSPNTTGVFSLGLMDNGVNRLFPSGLTCGSSGAPACYSTIPVWQIDESAKTATFTFHQILPTNLYNFFGGNTELLANGNIEYDLCGTPTYSYVYEVTPTSTPQTVWSLHATGTYFYRAFRIPSLYPGVQW